MRRTRREQRIFPINVRQLTVARVVDVSPGLRRITLTGDQLGAFVTPDGIAVPVLRNEGFDDHVKVIVAGPGQHAPVPPIQVNGHLDWNPPQGRPYAKDYTPRRWDPAAGELDLEFVRHGDGPAASWAESVRVGDPAWIAGPKSSGLLPAGVDWMLAVGDETALPAIGRLLDDAPDDLTLRVLIEIPDARYEVPLADRPRAVVEWVHRGDTPPGASSVLVDALRSLDWPDGEVFAWVAGETLTLKPIRAYLKNDRLVPRDCLDVTGYWRRSEPQPPAVADDASAVSDEVPAGEDDGHDRLHALADLVGPYALRAAVTCGLIEALDGRTATISDLAAATGTHAPTLASLARVLALRGVLEAADLGGPTAYGLGPLGPEIVEDEHSLAAYHLDGPSAVRDLAVAGLAGVLADGRPGADRAGRTPTSRLADDHGLAGAWWRQEQDEFAWPAPSIADHLDWGRHATVVGMGARSLVALVAIARTHLGVRPVLVDLPSMRTVVAGEVDPDIAERLAWVDQSPLAVPPAGGGAVLAVQTLERLGDTDAAAIASALLSGDAMEVVFVEQVVDGAEDDEDVVVADLLSRCAFGAGVRTIDQVAAVLTAAGAASVEVIDIGWERRLFRVTTTA